MSIAPLKRVAVIGRVADKPALLDGLQELGCLHVTPIANAERADASPHTSESSAAPGTSVASQSSAASMGEGAVAVADAGKALKFLKDAPVQRRQVVDEDGFAFDAVVAGALQIKTRLRVAQDKRDHLLALIADVEPWGDIDVAAYEAEIGLACWFYVTPRRARAAFEALNDPWAVVHADERSAYVVVLAAEEPDPALLPGVRVQLGSEPLSVLRRTLRETEIDIDDLIAERIAFTRYIGLITAQLYEAENAARRRDAEHAAYVDADLCALEGWAPDDRLADVETFAASRGLAVHSAPPGSDDAPPTLLRQPAVRQSGVDLSMFYQVPDYRSWDPTLSLLISFPLFFAMIMADAGYGLLLGGVLALYWRRLGGTARGRSYRLLGAWIAFATCLYGALVGSYFGASPPAGSVFAAMQRLSVNDFDTMMKLSIGVGVLHIVIANLFSAYVHRRAPDVLSKFGWVAVALGGYALYAAGGAERIKNIATLSIIVGAVLVFFFSSQERGRTVAAGAKRALDGAQALAGAMTAFGDVLSYMRLFALGLASASLAVTFNQLAAKAHDALPGLGVLAAALILLLGHGLNLALGVVSGVVHGLRLNYIEFFKWGFDDEGRAFTPFSKKRLEIT